MKAHSSCTLWSQIDQLISLPSPITYVQTASTVVEGHKNQTSKIIGGQFHQRFWIAKENPQILKVEIFHFEADQIPKVIQTHFFESNLEGDWERQREKNDFSFHHWELKECTTQIPAF